MFRFATRLLTGLAPVALAVLSLTIAVPQAHAQDKVLRVGTLKLIHGISAYFYDKFVPAGYTVEVIPFESPTDGKNAVLTGTSVRMGFELATSSNSATRATGSSGVAE